jgi:hypothetical protein
VVAFLGCVATACELCGVWRSRSFSFWEQPDVRVNWRHYSPDEQGWTPGITMALFLSLAFAAGGTMLGEVCFWLAETYRMGNGHMSYRAGRLFWVRHRPELFAVAVIVFWLAALEAACHLWSDRSTGT